MTEQQDEISVGADVDVTALMADVRAEVERKRQEGLYPPEVIEELDALGAGPRADPLTKALLGLRHGVSFDTHVTTASQIPFVAPVAASFKRAVRSSVHWYVSALVQQFEQFGANVLNVLNLMAERLRELEGGDGRHLAPSPSLAAESALDYFDFERRFRGTEDEIRRRQEVYVEGFRGARGPVIDLGCGRGEFLELLAEAGIRAYGVDRHPDMVARCRNKGLDARVGDALDYLGSVPRRSLGGIFTAQMIEHLRVPDVPRFFELAASALSPGGRLIVETLNPESLVVFAGPLYVDLGHLRPLHPLTLRFLAEKVGFRDIRVEYSALPPAEQRPAEIPPVGRGDIDRVIDAVNENFKRLDRLIFGPQDYAVVATR